MGTQSETSTALDDISDIDSEDVQRACKLLHHLQRENQQLTQNFDDLKALHLQLASAHSQLQSSHETLQQERVAIEHQYQQLCESWREELEQKQRQLEDALKQMAPPEDLDLLRTRLAAEAEAPCKAKCERLAKEAEAAHEAFVRLRREHEALQNAHNALEQRFSSELQLVRLETDAAEAAVAKRLAGQQQLQDRAASLEQQLRTARQRADEAAAQLRGAREEAAELRAAKEEAVVAREQGLIRGERMIKQMQAEAAKLRVLSEGLARKARHLQAELDESTRAQESAHDRMLSLQASNSTLSSRLADAEAAAARERRLAADRAAAAERQWRDKISELMQESLGKDRQLAEATLQHQQRLVDAAAAAEARAAAAEDRAAERALEAAAAASQAEAAEQAAAEWQQRALQCEEQARAEVASAKQESQEARAALASAQRLADGLQRELQEGRRGRERTREMLSGMEERLQQAGGASGAAEGRAAAAGSCDGGGYWEERARGLAAELSELRAEFGAARAEWEKRAAAARRAWEEERQGLVSKHHAQVRKLQEGARDQVRALQEKSKGHKARASGLASEVAALEARLLEREAELRAADRQQQQQQQLGLQQLLGAGSTLAAAGGSPAGKGAVAAGRPHVKAGLLEAAMADVRQRQEAYLNSVG